MHRRNGATKAGTTARLTWWTLSRVAVTKFIQPWFSAATKRTALATRHTKLCGLSPSKTVIGEFNAALALRREKQRGEQNWFRSSGRVTGKPEVIVGQKSASGKFRG